jgi:hypothetical protein
MVVTVVLATAARDWLTSWTYLRLPSNTTIKTCHSPASNLLLFSYILSYRRSLVVPVTPLSVFV